MRLLYSEAVLWATLLTKIEGKCPRTLDRIKFVAVDDLFRFFLGHCVWFAHDLHCLHPIRIHTTQLDGDATLIERLLDLGHVDRAIFFRTRRCGDCIYRNDGRCKVSVRRNVEEESKKHEQRRY